MKKKMLMLATTAAMSEQFNKNNILLLEQMGYEVHVAGNFLEGNPVSQERLEIFKQWLAEHQAFWHHIPATRSPLDAQNNVAAYKQVVELIKTYEFVFIHCHTPIGSVIGRIAAHNKKTKIMYTAHGFHFFKGAPLINWILYYPIERFLSRWTDVLITINKEDYTRAKRSFHAKQVVYVPGVGIDLDKYKKDSRENAKRKRAELNLAEDDDMLLSVGELNANKNHEVVIRAMAQLDNPKIHYFVAGKGELKEFLEKLAAKLGISEQVHLLGYRDDIKELLQCTDLYVFPSQREGLSVALMEAIASHVPVVCSRIRGNTDLVVDEKNMFEAHDVESVCACIKHAIGTENASVVEENYRNINNYSLKNVRTKMKEIYEEVSVSVKDI